jgi:uncharacterized protein (TIGR00251 family)
LTPKAGKDEISGIVQLSDGRTVLAVRVKALPQDGKANAALLRLFSRALGLPLNAVKLEAGATSRLKTLSLRGDVLALRQRLSSLIWPAR